MLIEVIFYLVSAFAVAILFKENHKYKLQNSQLRHNLYQCKKKLKEDEDTLTEVSKNNLELENEVKHCDIIKEKEKVIEDKDRYLELELEDYKEQVRQLTEKTQDMEKYKMIIKKLKNEMELLKIEILKG